jgi:hypothetical protein
MPKRTCSARAAGMKFSIPLTSSVQLCRDLEWPKTDLRLNARSDDQTRLHVIATGKSNERGAIDSALDRRNNAAFQQRLLLPVVFQELTRAARAQQVFNHFFIITFRLRPPSLQARKLPCRSNCLHIAVRGILLQ